jgi:hypothetical protein
MQFPPLFSGRIHGQSEKFQSVLDRANSSLKQSKLTDIVVRSIQIDRLPVGVIKFKN